jgi:DhnA family fructose-bisphosphate aldolase class Ia
MQMEYMHSAVGAGKVKRASQFIQDDGRAFLCAIDMQTGSGSGPALDAVVDVAEGGADGILVSWQIARRYPEVFRSTGMILRIDGTTSMLGNYGEGDKFAQMYELEMALRLGADAVVCMAFPGSDDEEVGLRKLVAIVNEAEKVGMPVIAESIPGSWARTVPWDPEHLARAARICVEVGADAIKTPATEDLADMATVIDNVEAPVFILGGPKKDTEDEAVQYAADVVAAGASGIAFGRNTWGSVDPRAMAAKLHAAVHGA